MSHAIRPTLYIRLVLYFKLPQMKTQFSRILDIGLFQNSHISHILHNALSNGVQCMFQTGINLEFSRCLLLRCGFTRESIIKITERQRTKLLLGCVISHFGIAQEAS